MAIYNRTTIIGWSEDDDICDEGDDKFDIIKCLLKRHMICIAEDVFGHLDATDLKSAEMVSKTWYWTIREGNLWKKLYRETLLKSEPILKMIEEKILSLNPKKRSLLHEDEFMPKKLLLAYKNLCNNLKTGRHQKQIKNLGEISVTMIEMDTKRIILALVDCSIIILNRWTLEREFVLVYHPRHEWITDMQLQDNLIFSASIDGWVVICDLNSKQVIQQFQDQREVDAVYFRANRKLFVTCSTSLPDPLTGNQDTTITVRSMSDLSLNEMTIQRRESIPGFDLCLIESDDKYFALFFTSTDQFKIQLRTASAFDIVRELNNLPSPKPNGFAYFNGYLATESSTGFLEIWDLQSQTIHQTIHRTVTVKEEEFEFHSGYITSRGSDGKFTVWNLPPGKDFKSNGNYKISGEVLGPDDPSFRFDGSQILYISVTNLSPDRDVSNLIIRDFIGGN